MAKITITKGNEFMIAVKDEITKDDLFIELYKRAANILDRIVGASIEVRDKKEFWKSQDYENNIIAFCGERGEGKSSVMMTFVNAIYHNLNKEIFLKEVAGSLALLSKEVTILNAVNLYDINIVAEDFFPGLLNLIYGYKLKNANYLEKNAPAIDLFDKINKRACRSRPFCALLTCPGQNAC